MNDLWGPWVPTQAAILFLLFLMYLLEYSTLFCAFVCAECLVPWVLIRSATYLQL